MSEEEKMLRDLVERWFYYEGHLDPEKPNVTRTAIRNFSGDVEKARAYLASKDAAKERTTKINEIYKELAEDRRKTRVQQGALLGWESASRKMKRLGIPVPEGTKRDWDCKPCSAPGIGGEVLEGEHSPTYIAASWTGEWKVWGWKDGTYWSHHGKVSRKAIEERVESVMNGLYRQAAAEKGVEL